MDLSPSGLSRIMEDCDLHLMHELGTVDDIARLLDSDSQNGINSIESIENRKKRYGENVLPDIPVRSFWELFKEALSDETILILIGCAIFSLIFEIIFASTEERSTAWVDGAAILMAVAIVSLVQATSNTNQEIQFAAVNRIKSVFSVTVVRCGKFQKVLNNQRKNNYQLILIYLLKRNLRNHLIQYILQMHDLQCVLMILEIQENQ